MTAISASLRHHPAFLHLWIASTGASFAFEMLSVAVGWQVYATTGRVLDLGLLAAWVGAVPAVVIGGVGTLVTVALWMRWFPTLRRRQRLRGDGAG